MNYRERFNRIKGELLAAGARIDHEDSEMAMDGGMRQHYQDEENFTIPDDLAKLFESFDGLSFRWSRESEGQKLAGFFQIALFLDLMDNETENKLWADFYEPEDIARIKQHRILEMFNGMDYYVTILFEQGSNDYQLYYVPEGSVDHGGSQTLARIPLTIAQYVELIFGYYGIHSVRHHLHRPEFYVDPEKFIPEYELLRKTFPHFNPPRPSPVF